MPVEAVSLMGAAAAFGMETWSLLGGEAIVVAVSEYFYTAPAVAPEKKPVLVIWHELRRVRC